VGRCKPGGSFGRLEQAKGGIGICPAQIKTPARTGAGTFLDLVQRRKNTPDGQLDATGEILFFPPTPAEDTDARGVRIAAEKLEWMNSSPSRFINRGPLSEAEHRRFIETLPPESDSLKSESRTKSPSRKMRKRKGRKRRAAPPRVSPKIAKRRAIVKKTPKLTAPELCKKFDWNSVPLTKALSDAGNWTNAYRMRKYRHIVESLISRDRQS
jgi:hypothetical protein